MEVMINNSWGSQVINNGIHSGTGFPLSEEKNPVIAGKKTSGNEDYTKGLMDINDVKNLLYMMIGVNVKIESPKGAVGRTINSVA